MRWENMPFTQQIASSPGSSEFSTEASMPPDPEADKGNVMRFSVWKTCRNNTWVSSMQPRNHGSRCPTNGVARARYTRGSIEDGPGVIIKRTGGLSSPIGLLMSAPSRILMKPQGWPAGSYFGESLEYGGKSSVTQGQVERNGQIGWGRGGAALVAC